jgi:hypothetical protein
MPRAAARTLWRRLRIVGWQHELDLEDALLERRLICAIRERRRRRRRRRRRWGSCWVSLEVASAQAHGRL